MCVNAPTVLYQEILLSSTHGGFADGSSILIDVIEKILPYSREKLFGNHVEIETFRVKSGVGKIWFLLGFFRCWVHNVVVVVPPCRLIISAKNTFDTMQHPKKKKIP